MGGRESDVLACREIVRDLITVVVETGAFLLGTPESMISRPAIQSRITPTVAIPLIFILGRF